MTLEQDARQRAPRRLRVLVAKAGLDGHDRGVKIVARALRDAGIEIVYLGIHNTPAEIVAAALQEDVDAIGVSIHSAAHLTLFGELMHSLEANRARRIVVFGGGIIPDEDIGKLKRMGVRRIFTPGASLESIVSFVRSLGGWRAIGQTQRQPSVLSAPPGSGARAAKTRGTRGGRASRGRL